MPQRECGSANRIKLDHPVTINHRLAKLVLHTAANRHTSYRAHLCDNGYLLVHVRNHGTAWVHEPKGLPEPIQEIVEGFLKHRGDHDYYYLDDVEVQRIVDRYTRADRLARVKQPA